ncbi:MAG: hypothetical protein N4A61_07475 [Pelagimonas sp.]|jgi:hypothetical protein|nr:hypothetical protein [Pelagimonas sp.]
MRLSKTPSLILTGFLIFLGLVAQDVRAMDSGAVWQWDCPHKQTPAG